MAKDTMQELTIRVRADLAKETREKIIQMFAEAHIEGIVDAIKSDKAKNAYLKHRNELMNSFKGLPSNDMSSNAQLGMQIASDASKVSGKIGDDIMKIMKTSVGILEDIHSRIKQASPLLQSVESLFNLAMQLFFMPLGNKLAEVMIPAILELVDDVMAMWDKIEGMDLGELATTMINEGAKIFGQYFNNLGEQLANQSGIVGSIGHILIGLGDFVEHHLADLINVGVNILQFIFDNFGTLVNAFIEFKILSLALQAAQLGATIAGPAAIVGAIAGAGIVEIGANSVLASNGVFDATSKMNNRAASGAYVGAIEGGRDVTVAEGGEGEFILPESRLQSMMDVVADRMVDTVAGLYADMDRQPVMTENIKDEPTISESRLQSLMGDLYDRMNTTESISYQSPAQNERGIDTSKLESLISDMGDMVSNDLSTGNITVINADEDKASRIEGMLQTLTEQTSGTYTDDVMDRLPAIPEVINASATVDDALNNVVPISVADEHYDHSEDILQNIAGQMSDVLSRSTDVVSAVPDVQVAKESTPFVFPTPEAPKSTSEKVSDRLVDTAPKTETKVEAPKTETNNTYNNFYITGYTDSELQDIIRRTVNEQVSQSKLRSGF